MEEIVFVLGSPNSNDGTLSGITLSRVERAIELLEDLPQARIMVTGGFGSHFNQCSVPHRQLVHRYLEDRGVRYWVGNDDALLSSNTVEDAVMIGAFTKASDNQKYTVVTSSFHLERCKFIFQCLGFVPDRFAGATDPTNLSPDIAAHETRALAHLMQQGGVMLNGVLYPHPSLA